MAHKKGVGSTDNGRDSHSKRLGVKLFGGQVAKPGNIIIRQRGTKYHPGLNVNMGKDFTIHASIDGNVTFHKGRRGRTFVSITPIGGVVAPAAPVKKAKKAKAAPVMAAAPVVEEKTVMAAAAPVVEETPVVEAPKAKKKKKAASGEDDFRKIEGIGPKISQLIKDAGIPTFADLAKTDVEKLKEILDAAGSRYRMHNPASWPLQAGMAAEGKWDELKVWQDEHDGGKL